MGSAGGYKRGLEEAGLTVGPTGGIVVSPQMQTSDPHIWAVGDVTENANFVTGEQGVVALAGPANRQGRIAADNIAGKGRTYRGTQGTAVCGVLGLTAAATGAGESRAALGADRPGEHVEEEECACHLPAAEVADGCGAPRVRRDAITGVLEDPRALFDALDGHLRFLGGALERERRIDGFETPLEVLEGALFTGQRLGERRHARGPRRFGKELLPVDPPLHEVAVVGAVADEIAAERQQHRSLGSGPGRQPRQPLVFPVRAVSDAWQAVGESIAGPYGARAKTAAFDQTLRCWRTMASLSCGVSPLATTRPRFMM